MKLICSTGYQWSDLRNVLRNKTDHASLSLLRNLDEYRQRTTDSPTGILLTAHRADDMDTVVGAAGVSFGCSVVKVHFHHVCEGAAIISPEQAMQALFREAHKCGRNFHYGHALIFCPAGKHFSSENARFREYSANSSEETYVSGDKGICFSIPRNDFQIYYT